MADTITEGLKLLGFATPFAYAGATFACFHYLDGKVSDEARAAVSAWVQPKEHDNAAVAHAVVEIFDRVYTRPLLSWRALLRSASITLTVMLIFTLRNRFSYSRGCRHLSFNVRRHSGFSRH